MDAWPIGEALALHASFRWVRFPPRLPGLVGRVDDCSCLENNRTERYRGFESYTSRVKMRIDENAYTPAIVGGIVGAVLISLGWLISRLDKSTQTVV